MSYSVAGTVITLTRGDTFRATVNITDSNGMPYLPSPGDTIRFAMNRSYGADEPLILKNIPTDTLSLVIDPEDTKTLPFGNYVYDIELTDSAGNVDTFIAKARLILTEEVY